MPVPQHIFDPPFNVIRSSHVVLDVVDLNASREFYENNVGLHVEDRDDEAVYLRGSEEHQHHSLLLRKARIAAATASASRSANEQDLDKAAAFFSENGIAYAFAEQPFQGAPCSSPIPSAFRSRFTHRWRSVRICCAATISTRAVTRNGSTTSTCSPPKFRTPSTSTRASVFG
jgi:catechol 2,3-dioxygenase